jgi:hypothetical protein
MTATPADHADEDSATRRTGTNAHVQPDRRFSLAAARAAGADDDHATWVGEFLASRGSDNAVLAAALAQQRHWWLGPIRLPVDDLVRLAGPDDEDVLCPIDEGEWEADVDAMEASVEDGWEPPPVLVEHQAGRLMLQDGNHRYEALARAGETHAWAIVYFDDEHERDRFATARAATDVDAG